VKTRKEGSRKDQAGEKKVRSKKRKENTIQKNDSSHGQKNSNKNEQALNLDTARRANFNHITIINKKKKAQLAN